VGYTSSVLGYQLYCDYRYDLKALFEKAFTDFSVNVQGLSRGMFLLKSFYWGQLGARENYTLQIRNIVEHGYESLGEKPVIIGECGVPMDMKSVPKLLWKPTISLSTSSHKEAFFSEDFTWQAKMMDAMLTGLERSLVGFT
jgi:hypothetical protein